MVTTLASAAEVAIERRYGGHPSSAILWNDVLSILLTHRSVRAYRPDPLPREALATLIAAAQSASTSSNQQYWSVIAIADPDRKAELARLAGNQKHVIDAPLLLLWAAYIARTERILAGRQEATEALDYLESLVVATIDASLAAQNAATAAESLGLGAVFIGGLRNRPEDVAAVVGLPPRAVVLFGLVVGWPDSTRPTEVKPRLPQASVLHSERYSTDALDEAVAAYDQTSLAFQAEQGLPGIGWISQVVRRSQVSALHGRERLREALVALGFGLR
jgi:nitroreductase